MNQAQQIVVASESGHTYEQRCLLGECIPAREARSGDIHAMSCREAESKSRSNNIYKQDMFNGSWKPKGWERDGCCPEAA